MGVQTPPIGAAASDDHLASRLLPLLLLQKIFSCEPNASFKD